MKFPKIKVTDIKDKIEFVSDGDILRRLESNEAANLYLYGRYWKDNGHLKGYELVRGVKRKQPDGSIVFTYPSSEQFGRYGWFFPPRTDRDSLNAAVREVNSDLIMIPRCKYLKDGRINPNQGKLYPAFSKRIF